MTETVDYWDMACQGNNSNNNSTFQQGDCFQPVKFDFGHPDVGRILLKVSSFSSIQDHSETATLLPKGVVESCEKSTQTQLTRAAVPLMISPFDKPWEWSAAARDEDEWSSSTASGSSTADDYTVSYLGGLASDDEDENVLQMLVDGIVQSRNGSNSDTQVTATRRNLLGTYSYNVGLCSASASTNLVSQGLV